MLGGTMPPADASFPKSYRLRRRPEFTRVQRGGRRIRCRAFTLCVSRNPLGHARFGFTVSKKVGNAVERNRTKRLLRDAARHMMRELQGVDVVVLARPHTREFSVEALQVQLRQGLGLLPMPERRGGDRRGGRPQRGRGGAAGRSGGRGSGPSSGRRSGGGTKKG